MDRYNTEVRRGTVGGVVVTISVEEMIEDERIPRQCHVIQQTWDHTVARLCQEPGPAGMQ